MIFRSIFKLIYIYQIFASLMDLCITAKGSTLLFMANVYPEVYPALRGIHFSGFLARDDDRFQAVTVPKHERLYRSRHLFPNHTIFRHLD